MKNLLSVLFIFLFAIPAYCQDEEADEKEEETKKVSISPLIMGGVTAGGAINGGSFLYTDGWNLTTGLAWKRTSRVRLGLTAGIEKLREETFIPVGFFASGYTSKKDESTVFGLQAGYAHGFSERMFSNLNYRFQGGLFFQPFAGYKTEVGKQELLLTIAYKHQFSEIVYTRENGGDLFEDHSYHLLSFRAGILF